jgi:hypothetical protein
MSSFGVKLIRPSVLLWKKGLPQVLDPAQRDHGQKHHVSLCLGVPGSSVLFGELPITFTNVETGSRHRARNRVLRANSY